MKQSAKLSNIKGFLFDVDGTLYHQLPLRIFMAILMILLNFYRPKEMIRKIRIVIAFRKAQEILRSLMIEDRNCLDSQIALTASLTGEDHDYIAGMVREWFEKRPLPFMRLCRKRGLKTVLERLHNAGFELGVHSDYPPLDKLKALGVADYFSTVVTPNDKKVNGFKPFTNGFAVAARRMGLKPSEILYVGDRPEVDEIGASASGMSVVIIVGRFSHKKICKYPTIKSFKELSVRFA